MVSQEDRYFYLSGALSLGIFFGTLALFASVLFSHQAVHSYALTQDSYISVSIDVPLQKRSKNHTKTPEPSRSEAASSVPEVAAPQVTEDVSTLFENVWTQDVTAKKTTKKQPADTKRFSAIERRIKTTQSTKSTQASEQINALKLARPAISVTGSASSSAAEVNEYYAKIQALIYDRFFPPANSEGQSAKIYLSLDASGRIVTQRVLVNSGNLFFDEEVAALMKRIGSVAFPAPPEGKPVEVQIILTAEE